MEPILEDPEDEKKLFAYHDQMSSDTAFATKSLAILRPPKSATVDTFGKPYYLISECLKTNGLSRPTRVVNHHQSCFKLILQTSCSR